MSARNRRPTFLREALFGLVLSIVGAAVGSALAFVLPDADAMRVTVAGLAFAYLIHILGASREKTGRIAAGLFWAAMTLAMWYWQPGIAIHVLVQVAFLWLARSLYLHGRFVEAMLDLVLAALAVSFGVWAGLRTGSLVLAAWSFFLIQALHVMVPALAERWLESQPPASDSHSGNRSFAEALAAGEEALRRIAARR